MAPVNNTIFKRKPVIGPHADDMMSPANEKLCIIRGSNCHSLLAHQDRGLVGSQRPAILRFHWLRN